MPVKDQAGPAGDEDEAGTRLAALEDLARTIDGDLAEIATRWSDLPSETRALALRRLERSAPGVLFLLCPDYRRFRSAFVPV